MSKKQALIGFILAFVIAFTACKDDVANTGESVLTIEDEVIVLADTLSSYYFPGRLLLIG